MVERGFTLIEVLVALAIASVSLIALTSRMGASVAIQRGLLMQSVMLDVANNLLNKEQLKPGLKLEEQQGVVEVYGQNLSWRLWVEKTAITGFMRQNIAVKLAEQPELMLFRYRLQ